MRAIGSSILIPTGSVKLYRGALVYFPMCSMHSKEHWVFSHHALLSINMLCISHDATLSISILLMTGAAQDASWALRGSLSSLQHALKSSCEHHMRWDILFSCCWTPLKKKKKKRAESTDEFVNVCLSLGMVYQIECCQGCFYLGDKTPPYLVVDISWDPE